MKTRIVLAVAALCIAALAADAEARMRGRAMAAGGEGEHLRHYMQTLDLSEAQQDNFQEMFNKMQKEVIRRRADRGVAEIDLREILDADKPDLKAAEAKIRQIAATGADIRVLHLKAAAEFRAILTPEQQAKFDALDESRFLGMGLDGGPGMGMGPHGGRHGMMAGGGKGMMMGKEGCPMMKGMGHGSPPPAAEKDAAPAAESAHKH